MVQNGIEQAGKFIGTHGTHNDRKRARKTLIRHPKLRQRPFKLTVVRILLFDAVKRHQDTRRAASKDARRRDGTRANQDGNKGSVAQLEHQLALGTIGLKWQTMFGRTLKSRRIQDVLNVAVDDISALLAHQVEQAIIHMQNGSVEFADDDRIARDLDQLGNVCPLVALKRFHREPHRLSVTKKPPKRLLKCDGVGGGT